MQSPVELAIASQLAARFGKALRHDPDDHWTIRREGRADVRLRLDVDRAPEYLTLLVFDPERAESAEPQAHRIENGEQVAGVLAEIQWQISRRETSRQS
jgi:hypothetical protein